MELLPVIVLIVACLGLIFLPIVVQWIIFQKAGKPGWASIIPIYSLYVLLKIVGKPGWWLLLFCIPVVNIVYLIWTINMLSKSFGKDEGFTVGLVLLGIVFYPILAFGSARYLGPYGDPVAFRAAQSPDFDFDKGGQPS
jgi:hypothetical protein